MNYVRRLNIAVLITGIMCLTVAAPVLLLQSVKAAPILGLEGAKAVTIERGRAEIEDELFGQVTVLAERLSEIRGHEIRVERLLFAKDEPPKAIAIFSEGDLRNLSAVYFAYENEDWHVLPIDFE